MFGKTVDALKEAGKQIKCMVLELLTGLMAKFLVVNMRQIKRMAEVS